MAQSSKTRRRRRPNPDAIASAAELSESFHGRPAEEITYVEETDASYPAVADLGELIELKVRVPAGVATLNFEGAGVRVCSTADGRNLLFVGGDQALDLESIEIESDKDQLPLGECTRIVYHTSKAFHDFEPTNYRHAFGEETGERPTLGYSQLNERIYLEGGAYQVQPEGITN